MNFLILIILGLGWGLSFTLGKIAITAGGTPIGLTFWQSLFSGLILLAYVFFRHGKLIIPKKMFLPIVIITFLSVVIPNIIFYACVETLDAGVLSISVSVIPLFTYLIALGLRMDNFKVRRVLGLITGFCALLILILPENSLPDKRDIPWVLLALNCALCYALENIYIDRLALQNFGPIRLVCAVSFVSAIITFPLSLVMDQFFILQPTNLYLFFSTLGLGFISATAYSIFIYLIGRAGSVFSSQVGYLVTFFGVVWGIIILGESHSVFVWITLVMIMMGIFLVQPKQTNESTDFENI
ncbi:DMT family transporter [Paracoccaceae bacterium]|nr:DMT family transporter [Paracoccaceae bacterium]